MLKIIDPETSNFKLPNVAHMVRGKSPIIKLLGIIMKGICFILHPILSITAYQVHKFLGRNKKYGAIKVHSLDDASPAHLKIILTYLCGLKRSTRSTIFTFTSPQFLAKNDKCPEVLIKCSSKGMLHSIVAAEAQFFTIHGMSFWAEIRVERYNTCYPTRKFQQ